MNLVSAFGESTARQPNKIALFWGDKEFSYQQLWQSALSAAEVLRNQFGVRLGDRVGLWLKNCPEFISAYFGILRTGAIVVPINNFLKPQEVRFILADAGVEVLITDQELGAHFSALKGDRPGLKLAPIDRVLSGSSSGSSDWPERKESDVAVLIYTSGTTGRPKGAMLSHGNLLHNIESCRIVLRTVAADRFAVLLPLFHSYMMTVGMLLPLLVGGSMVLVKSLHPVKNAFQEILQRQTSVLPAIPQFFRSIVNAALPTPLPLRICISGAAPLPGQVLKEFEERFKVPLIEGYGLSEASPVVTKNPLDGTHKAGSIGLPIANVEVSIQDESGRQLGAGQIGEVCVRGGNVMLGYWNKPEETARVMRQGWLLTGDVGYRDEDGYYFITDRKKDMLLVNGINVYPREIEEILYEFPGIKEAAVIGKPDERKGEKPVAFVAANDGAQLEEKAIQQFVRRKLADYKVPRQVIVLPALPRNATGKILKTALRELPLGAAA
jgi:long-chain acyl-CoA synthetase